MNNTYKKCAELQLHPHRAELPPAVRRVTVTGVVVIICDAQRKAVKDDGVNPGDRKRLFG